MFFYIYIIIFAAVFLIVLCGVLFYQSSKNKANGNEQFEVNKKSLEYLQPHNFKVSKIFYLTDSHSYNKDNQYKKIIVADNENKQICFIDYLSKKYYIVNFHELLNYELYENDSIVTNGGAIGGFGVGVFGAEANGNCKELKLIIRIKSLTTPQIAYELLSNYMAGMGLHKSAPPYRACISSLQEVASFLEVVMNDNLQNCTMTGA